MTKYFRCMECCEEHGQNYYGEYIERYAPCYLCVTQDEIHPIQRCPYQKLIAYDDPSEWHEIDIDTFLSEVTEGEDNDR